MSAVLKPCPLALRARQATGMSQTEFAEVYRLTVGSVRNWEQLKRDPDLAAQVLLALIEQDPFGMAVAIQGLKL